MKNTKPRVGGGGGVLEIRWRKGFPEERGYVCSIQIKIALLSFSFFVAWGGFEISRNPALTHRPLEEQNSKTKTKWLWGAVGGKGFHLKVGGGRGILRRG